MEEHPRYRVEDGVHAIDVRIASLEQLFDNRDPAPFRVRDLDPDFVEYLTGAAEDLMPHGPFRVVLWLSGPSTPTVDVAQAVRSHFEYELQRSRRRRRRQRRAGLIMLALSVMMMIALISAAQLIARLPVSGVRDAIREGLVILSWVLMWRPIDLLIFEWLPVHRQHTVLRRLLDAPVELRTSEPPTA
jgi:hypothetical protein